jgi:DnaJ-class molecular chaperone
MFEDFTYITDEMFLSNYWLEEKVVCQHCQGKGIIALEVTGESIPCPYCQGKGLIKRRQMNTTCS